MKEITLIARIPIFMLIIFVLVSPIQAALESDKKPNIVLVLMDNFGFGFEYTPIRRTSGGEKNRLIMLEK